MPLSRDDALVVLAAGVLSVVGNVAAVGFATTRLVLGRVDAVVVNATPSALVTFSIQQLGSAGNLLHLALSAAVTVGAFAAVALGGLAVARRTETTAAGVTATAGVAALGAYAATASPLAAVGSGVGASVPVAVAVARSPGSTVDLDRRRTIEFVGSVSALAAVGSAAGVLRTPESAADVGGREPREMLDAAAAASFDVDGLGGLVSTRRAHYEVDINAIDPSPSAGTHTLTVTGAVDAEREFTMAQLRALPTESRYNTLRCVGDDLNGEKIDTAVWTGTPTDVLLEGLEPEGDCECVMLRAADGYHVQFPLDALRGGLLAYGMNGKELPKGHGFPVRALVPGHWGETNVKWLTEIEFLDEAADGYWEKRGWQGTGPVETVAKIHATERHGDGRVTVAGPAYAGTRGVERVEVSTDDGDTWQDAALTDPLPGDDVWRQWRATVELDEPTEVVARATDGTGRLQPAEQSGSYPSGASGWVSTEVRP
ncbi:molybdopterin-dependent oxidoreductase [Halorubellus sp. PRR65]|uniref:molybdopterin-dependent oxidoreductase n=1 Tax=Halorubellus sp. PRR65 TaxID=3098148 RepID=UPI002B25AD6B|nr:molybdopterin-dependent oxidoreductase [Halorubellus sp. PRR65]